MQTIIFKRNADSVYQSVPLHIWPYMKKGKSIIEAVEMKFTL